jgi:hypothetical protein
LYKAELEQQAQQAAAAAAQGQPVVPQRASSAAAAAPPASALQLALQLLQTLPQGTEMDSSFRQWLATQPASALGGVQVHSMADPFPPSPGSDTDMLEAALRVEARELAAVQTAAATSALTAPLVDLTGAGSAAAGDPAFRPFRASSVGSTRADPYGGERAAAESFRGAPPEQGGA